MVKYDCEDIQELLYDYAENLLPARQKTMVAHHLEKCAECAKELEEIKQVIALLQNLPEEPLPQDFDEKLHLALIAAASNIDEDDSKPKDAAAILHETVIADISEAKKPVKHKAEKNPNKKPIWQRAWFPRSIAAAILLFFGMVSASYANDYFGFFDFGSEKGLNKNASMDIAEKTSCGTTANEATTTDTAVSIKSVKADTEGNIEADDIADANGALSAETADDIIAKAFPPVGFCSGPISLASRGGGSTVHEYMPLLPETAITNSAANKGGSNMAFNNHIASDEAADENYYWQDYDYAKLLLLTENKEDALKQAAVIAKNFNGFICKEFYDYNEDVNITTQNSIMLDLPVDYFDKALTELSVLGNIESCYLPDKDTGKNYTFAENGINYRSIVVIFEVKQ